MAKVERARVSIVSMKQKDRKEVCGMLPLDRSCIVFALYCEIRGHWKILSRSDMIFFSLNKISSFLIQKNLKEFRAHTWVVDGIGACTEGKYRLID